LSGEIGLDEFRDSVIKAVEAESKLAVVRRAVQRVRRLLRASVAVVLIARRFKRRFSGTSGKGRWAKKFSVLRQWKSASRYTLRR